METNIDKFLVEEKIIGGGFQKLYYFPNGYGASYINHSFSYGNEIAVLIKTENGYEICYDTPITSNVLVYLSDEEVYKTLTSIMNLPKIVS